MSDIEPTPTEMVRIAEECKRDGDSTGQKIAACAAAMMQFEEFDQDARCAFVLGCQYMTIFASKTSVEGDQYKRIYDECMRLLSLVQEGD